MFSLKILIYESFSIHDKHQWSTELIVDFDWLFLGYCNCNGFEPNKKLFTTEVSAFTLTFLIHKLVKI